MKGIFSAIVDFFSMIGSFFVFLFNGLMMLFNVTANGLRVLISLVSLLPLPFTIGAIGLVVVCVLYKVLGRENQS